jgi:phage repressor protein C with HTH and peptisase S24 domain
VETEISTGFYAFNRKWLARRGLALANLAVISVRGDSMKPDLNDKDLILLDRSQIIPADGDVYVLRYSGILFVKRVQVVPGNCISLLSTNPAFRPINVPMPTSDAAANDAIATDLTFIGRVVASMHEW